MPEQQQLRKKGFAFNIGDEEYALDFQHEHGAWPRTIKMRGVERQVICGVRTAAICLKLADDGHSYDAIAVGVAYCSPNDTPDREIGRQVALHELLRELPKEERGNKTHLGQRLLRVYLQRPNALPWAITDNGLVNYPLLRQHRMYR